MRIGRWIMVRKNACWQPVGNRASWAERFSRPLLDIPLPFTTRGGALRKRRSIRWCRNSSTYMADIDGRFHGVLAPNAGLRAAIVPGPPQNTGAAARTGAAAVSVPGGVIRKTRAVLQRGRQSGSACARAKRSKCVGVQRFGLM